MEYTEVLKQIFGIAVGSLAALLLAFYVVWPKVENLFLRVNSINQSKDLNKERQQLQFAAYERLLLFAHRISPYQVMLRNHNQDSSVEQFTQTLLHDIENEYQHNFTQQLYVSDASWTVVKDLKDSTVSLLKNAKKVVNATTTVEEYIAIVLKHVSELKLNPYDAAQVILKKELSA